ncbi:MAG TPA: AAA family ATPase [Spirochaetota bacterium]|nr:AAA family ATPase [Spirochaetota bacterium]
MATVSALENQLAAIANWATVSYKKNLLKELARTIADDERIDDLLEGFYAGEETLDAGKELPGILCTTDRRIVFFTSERSKPLVREVRFSDIAAIETEKGYAAMKIAIKTHAAKTMVFKSFSRESTVNRFLEAVSASASTMPVTRSDRSTDAVDRLTDIFVSRALPGFIDKLRSAVDDLAPGTGAPGGDIIEDVSNLNFLFAEAKKICDTLGGFLALENGAELRSAILNDLMVLSSLGIVSAKTINDPEKLFMSLVLLPFSQESAEAVAEKTRQIYAYDSFPLHFRDKLREFWGGITSLVEKSRISLENDSLASLALLDAYDREKGTTNAERAGAALYAYAQCVMKADGVLSAEDEERLKQIHALINRRPAVSSADGKVLPGVTVTAPEKEETIEEVMEKINKLVGMENIKEEIKTFINLIKVQKEREQRKLPVTPLSLHAVFYGPPGTGKTTIARLLSRVYRAIGLLKKGHLVETDRAGLVAGYVGQTAIKVDEVVQKALDGVLFIDEAYSLVPEDGGKDFGAEAIDAILKRMEDYRDRLVVIVAGYTDEMKRFIESNPGLKSRFSRYFYFDHYKPDDLMKIFDISCTNVRFTVTDTARKKLAAQLEALYEKRDRSFGNGRLVRNIFEKIVERQANRIAGITPLTDEILCTLTEEDIPEKIGLAE